MKDYTVQDITDLIEMARLSARTARDVRFLEEMVNKLNYIRNQESLRKAKVAEGAEAPLEAIG